ncbi:MAG: RagB/SusD family nutrient uptake outer membrane protein [Marinifilaceae bacterium]
MIRFNIILLLIIVAISFSACNDDFLERKPSDRINSETFFKQEKDLIFAVNAVYESLGVQASWTWAGGYGTDMMRLETMTDNALDDHGNNANYKLAYGIASSYDGYCEGWWNTRYRGIQRVNRILEGEKDITDIEEDFRARLLAEAKFLRAYFYFDLAYLFGDVPYLTESITPEDTKPTTGTDGEYKASEKVKRTPKEEILNDLTKQLSTIAKDLPIQYDENEKGRVTRGAALALKARILLYQEKWDEAAAAAKAVMDLKTYSLYPSYQKMFDYDGLGNSEVIFDLQVMPDVDKGEFYYMNFGPNSIGGWSCTCPLQSLVDTYECIDGKSISESSLFDPNNPYANRDPRLGYSILYPGHDWQGGVFNTIPGATYPGKEIVPGDSYDNDNGSGWNVTPTGYNQLKYIAQSDIDESKHWENAVHFILIRYSDVLLMYAEAKVEANDIDNSVYDAIDAIRGRDDVQLPAIAKGKSREELRQIVRRERRVELAFEGLRLLDIRRWKIAHEVMPGKPEGLTYTDSEGNSKTMTGGKTRIFEENKHYLWPIPQSEIDISHISQNPKW